MAMPEAQVDLIAEQGAMLTQDAISGTLVTIAVGSGLQKDQLVHKVQEATLRVRDFALSRPPRPPRPRLPPPPRHHDTNAPSKWRRQIESTEVLLQEPARSFKLTVSGQLSVTFQT